MKPVVLLLLSVAGASLGQIFFKKGVLAIGEVHLKGVLAGGWVRLLFHPAVFSGLVLYFISTVLWLMALSRTTLSFAYPFTALTFALVMLSARFVFQETIPVWRYAGFFFICLGILISSLAEG